jgi:uncharacterized protein (DUF302 family)
MSSNSMIVTYRIPEPFERAIESVRETAVKSGLSIPMELDISRRIQRELGIALAPCRVLYVDNPLLLLQAVALHPSAAVWLPLSVVVAGYGPQTLVHVLQRAGAAGAGNAVENVHIRLSRALESVAMREGYYQSA